MSITVSGLSAGYGQGPSIISNLDLTIEQGEVSILIGPNGCGKSTLLKSIGRLLTPRTGSVCVEGFDVLKCPAKESARKIAFLPQDPVVPAAISVEQLVGYGRAPHQSLLGLKSPHDNEMIEYAIEIAGIEHLRHRTLADLSGGQKQSAFFAMVLAQDTPYALLDEPTNHLDITHQIAALELIRKLNIEHGKTALVVLHDLNLAARYADRLILLHNGAIYADGSPEEVLSPKNIRDVFEVEGRIVLDPVNERPLCVPYPLH